LVGCGGLTSRSIDICILGCCTSRDIFNLPSEDRYALKLYVQHQNPLLLFQTPLDQDLTEDDIIQYSNESSTRGWIKDRLKHRFNRRVLMDLFNCNNYNKLNSCESDWIILDSYYFHTDKLLIVSDGKNTLYFQDDTNSLILYEILTSSSKFKSYSIQYVVANIDYTRRLDLLCDFLLQKWGSNIILIDTPPAMMEVIDDHLNLTSADVSISLQNSFFCKMMCERLDLHLICIPGPLISHDHTHIHYVYDTVCFLHSCIENIVFENDNPSFCFQIADYLDRINQLVSGDRVDAYARLSFIKNTIEKKIGEQYQDAYAMACELEMQGNIEALAYMGHLMIELGIDLNLAYSSL